MKEKVTLSEKQEEKRLEDFREIAENWDKLPELVQGKIDGAISMAATIFLGPLEKDSTNKRGR